MKTVTAAAQGEGLPRIGPAYRRLIVLFLHARQRCALIECSDSLLSPAVVHNRHRCGHQIHRERAPLKMTDIIQGSIYDFPKYYDLLFGSDWKAEFDFLDACFSKHATRKVKRVFEPACGTGRLLIKLAKAGYEVGGNDLNEPSVEFCNDRLERFGFPRSALVQDMTDFRVRKKFDAAFNLINTFRHLPTEKAAVSHLECVAAALNKGGLYALGIHLEPTKGQRMEEESWSARRGNLAITSYMWSKGIDRRKRMEHLGVTLDIYTPTEHKRIVDHMEYRTYKHAQIRSLLKKVPAFEVAEVYDFAYDINQPHEITETSEDVVFVLKKR